jgi:CubicO group peptidase (beta-lactamase class C family)
MPRVKTIVLIVCVALTVPVFGCVGARGQSEATEPASRIARIEQGLLPAVLVTNGAPVKYTLAERLVYHKVPAVSVAFVENGTVAWARAYGVADVAAGTRATTETLFQAASISKPLAALAVLRLVQDGKLALDEDVNLKLKSWKVPENDFTKVEKVTLRRLLTHSAGTTVSGFPGYASTDAVPTTIQVLNGEKPANTAPVRVDVEPGKMMRYSGGGFTIMQLLVSDLTGKPFPQVMREFVLDPAGMTASTYEQPLPASMAARGTQAYLRSGRPVLGGPHTYPEMAAAGLWTTPSQLAKVAIDLEAAFEGRTSRILSTATIKQMLTHQRDGYGLGIAVSGEGQALRFGHNGANAGYRCQWTHYPNRDQGVIVMTNSDAGGEVMSELVRAIAAEYGWPDFKQVERTRASIDPSALPALAAVYQGERNMSATVTHENGRLFIQTPPLGLNPVELHPLNSSEFFVLTAALTFRFADDRESLVVQQGPNRITLTRVK